ncbi:MAG: response regulator [Candidatus Sericytochromatia bacterium]|nr:response regulator [Candidatus Sericytochromatia bacterium]
MRILLVEDVEDNRALARFLLESQGVDVDEACTGREALEALGKRQPDLILMDLSLPDMDGWDATRSILTTPEWRNIPIVALTAHAMAGDRERVMAHGFRGYMSKPIDVSTFCDQVLSFLPSASV